MQPAVLQPSALQPAGPHSSSTTPAAQGVRLLFCLQEELQRNETLLWEQFAQWIIQPLSACRNQCSRRGYCLKKTFDLPETAPFCECYFGWQVCLELKHPCIRLWLVLGCQELLRTTKSTVSNSNDFVRSAFSKGPSRSKHCRHAYSRAAFAWAATGRRLLRAAYRRALGSVPVREQLQRCGRLPQRLLPLPPRPLWDRLPPH